MRDFIFPLDDFPLLSLPDGTTAGHICGQVEVSYSPNGQFQLGLIGLDGCNLGKHPTAWLPKDHPLSRLIALTLVGNREWRDYIKTAVEAQLQADKYAEEDDRADHQHDLRACA